MTPYLHPQENLAIFQARLSKDAALTEAYTIECGKPVPVTSVTALDGCMDWRGRYNTLVDLRVAGGYQGEVDAYPYNRIDLGTFAKPMAPFLKGETVTVWDLLPRINAALGTSLLPSDVLDRQLPVCECACGPIGFDLVADPDSLIYVGSLRMFLHTHPLPLSSVVCQPFLGHLPLPPLTP